MRHARLSIVIAALAVLALLATACGSTSAPVESTVAASAVDTAEVTEADAVVDDAASAGLQAMSATGETITVANPGEDTLLWFWAPW